MLFALVALSAAGTVAADCSCGSKNPAAPCTGRAVSYTSGTSTIGFTFQCSGGDCYCGRFANEHDFWVAPVTANGTVIITGMTPAQTGTGASLRNGAMADPRTTRSVQGWNGSIEFDASLNIRTPYTVDPTALNRPTVIMKAHSSPSVVAGHAKCNDQRFCLEHVEALTVVRTPPGDVFRPPYFGLEKPMIPASSLNPSLLPALEPAGGELSYEQALASVTSVPVDHMWLWNDREHYHPRLNSGSPRTGYDGYVGQNEVGALLRMMLRPRNAGEMAQRDLLTRRVAQRGIDLYHIFKNGKEDRHTTCGGWIGTGGYGTGKLPQILIAATLLQQQNTWGTQLRNVLATEAGRQCFAETSLIQPPNGRGKNVALFGHKATSVYTPSQASSRTLADPQSLIDGGGNSESRCVSSYQQCCTTGIFRGGAIAVELVPQAMRSFPAGARHWLDWIDRISDEGAYCDPNTFRGTRYDEGHKVPGAEALYNRYRDCAQAGTCAGFPTGR